MSWTPQQMAARAAQELEDGMVVNLGIGLPTLVADQLPEGLAVWLQSENGLLGMGPYPFEEEVDPQLINAGKETVTALPGASTFDSVTSFAMIRGGHVDLAIMGALQVAENGDLANWAVPGGRTMGVGGAMDLAAGAKRLVVLTRHCTKAGAPKLVARCSYPPTARGVVSRVISELAVIDITEDGFSLVELAPGVDLEALRAQTGAAVRLA